MQIYHHLARTLALLGIGLLLLTSCSQSTAVTATASATPFGATAPTATPTIASGTYIFIRDGDLWLRTGLSRAHSFTKLNLRGDIGTWGSVAWSPDYTRFAFALRANPIAPGDGSSQSVQGTGTLYIGDLTTGAIRGLVGNTLAIKIPLQGQHIAWIDTTNLLITQSGTVQKLSLGQGPALVSTSATVSAVPGPRTVWDIAYRDNTLFYSTVANLQANGTGIAELHRFSLTAVTTADKLIATLGTVTLPTTQCGGIICPIDTTTPFVPFAWTVAANGKQIAYQTGTVAAKDATAVATANQFFTTPADSNQPTPIFTTITQPTAQVTLTFAPDGQQIAVALERPAQTAYGPYIQKLASKDIRQLTPPDSLGRAVVLGGPLSWSPDSQGISVTALPTNGTTTQPIAITYTLTGQSAITEVNASQLSWAA